MNWEGIKAASCFCVVYMRLLEFLMKGTSWVSSTAIVGTWLVVLFLRAGDTSLVKCIKRP